MIWMYKTLGYFPLFSYAQYKAHIWTTNIDVIISDIAYLYHESEILPSVPIDIPADQPGGGKASDHPIVMSKPKLNKLQRAFHRNHN